MKVFVKTLKGTQFEIEIKSQDTVANVKKFIETVKGPDVYPAAKQMLIHNGKVLNDDTTMEENEVSENSFIVVMSSKKNLSSAPPPPTPAAAPPPHPPSDIPLDTLLPPVAGAPPPGPNTNPLNLFPEVVHRPARAPGNLNFLRHMPRFQGLRYRVQCHPQILQPVLQQLATQNPFLAGLIHQHKEEFARMLLEPYEEGESVNFEPLIVQLTRADEEAIDRLEAMGFNRSLAFDMYIACDKNEEMAANYLLDHMDE